MLASLTRVGPIQRAIRLRCSPLFVSAQSNLAGHFFAVLHFDFWQGPLPRPRACIHSHLLRPAGFRVPPGDLPDCLAMLKALTLLFDTA